VQTVIAGFGVVAVLYAVVLCVIAVTALTGRARTRAQFWRPYCDADVRPPLLPVSFIGPGGRATSGFGKRIGAPASARKAA
jgi:hypothetical protein